MDKIFGSPRKRRELERAEDFDDGVGGFGDIAQDQIYVDDKDENFLEHISLQAMPGDFYPSHDWCKLGAFWLTILRAGCCAGVYGYSTRWFVLYWMRRGRKSFLTLPLRGTLAPMVSGMAGLGCFCYHGQLDQFMCIWRKHNDNCKVLNGEQVRYKPVDSYWPHIFRLLKH
mmetsp:Transcript_28668/g.31838  ORF Transcript_28668/g.31838 Transcript_28668/m.31838 type:complete len:171 (+) Transcript_28668:36-548(+)